MSGQESPRKPLQQRVQEILHVQNSAYIVEEIENNTALEILDELRDAEEELEQVQQRVARLRELLANVQPDNYA